MALPHICDGGGKPFLVVAPLFYFYFCILKIFLKLIIFLELKF